MQAIIVGLVRLTSSELHELFGAFPPATYPLSMWYMSPHHPCKDYSQQLNLMLIAGARNLPGVTVKLPLASQQHLRGSLLPELFGATTTS